MPLAQVNIARMKDSIDSPVMKGFVDALDEINAIADASPGFIWRLQGEEENATAIRVFEDDYLIINMSVWQDRDSLFNFVYKSDHLNVYLRKKEWFHAMSQMHMALWYVSEGHYPSPEEGKQKLEHLRMYGESLEAFTFKSKY
ncbi:MAG: DUF3291 domain-containing protein [Saprospiraceae bacterium]|nr:DUF3291 domain-containing protein [Saprospiraceae bacterium]